MLYIATLLCAGFPACAGIDPLSTQAGGPKFSIQSIRTDAFSRPRLACVSVFA